MLSVERKQQILDYLTGQKSAQVKELSTLLNVSLATIRRDLIQMDREGIIRRVHGGAVTLSDQPEPPILQRKTVHAEIKRRIGAKASELVNNGETILLTSGTTTEAMVPFLANKANLTVITNAINIAYQLTRYPQISVIVLGGWLRHTEFSLLGHLTDQALQDLRADKIFHGIFGIDPEYGLTSSDVQEAQTDRLIIRTARELIILADHTKFGKIGQVRLAPIQAVSTIVTDLDAPDDAILKLNILGIHVIQA